MVQRKKFIAGIICLVVSTTLCGQSVKVKKETARLKGENTEGVAVDLDGKAEEVSTSLLKYLKSLGKTKQNEGVIVLSEATIYGNLYKSPIYAISQEKGSMMQAWFGISKGEWATDDAQKINNELEKLAYDFGVKFYRDKIQVQIDESIRALLAVERQQQRLTNENKNLNVKLENNKHEKEQLEKSLVGNKAEHETLLFKIDKNKKDQDSVVVVGEQVKKVVEMHKERQRNVK